MLNYEINRHKFKEVFFSLFTMCLKNADRSICWFFSEMNEGAGIVVTGTIDSTNIYHVKENGTPYA